MKKKLRVAVLFGGRSAEHEVSLRSARSVIDAMDKNKYEPILIGLDKQGQWLSPAASRVLLNSASLRGKEKKAELGLTIPGPEKLGRIDVVFPVLHGPYGEDGTIQGLLKLAGVPFVGAGVLGSAVGMDKDVMKRLLKESGIPIGDFIVFRDHELKKISFTAVKKKLGLPLFVKPANLGSSVGISKVTTQQEFIAALKTAFRYDTKIIIEETILGREIECSVLGNEAPLASIPGEIISQHDFYSYDAKYIDEQGAILSIPAKLSGKLIKDVQKLAVKTYSVLCCEGLARVDMFLTKNGTLYINEINTLPGFTSISMYPKLWEASGLSYSKLIDKLIQLAIARFNKEKKLRTTS